MNIINDESTENIKQDNEIIASEYIKADIEEIRIKKSDLYLRSLQMMNRGISYDGNGVVHVNSRNFATYVLSRIDFFRTKSNQRWIKNQVTRVYESIDDIELHRIFITIMDEFNDEIYEYVSERKIIGFIDKLATTYKGINENGRYIVFPNGIYDTSTYSFDGEFKKDVILTHRMAFEYDVSADCPEWKRALKKMFPDDTQAIIDVLQEIFGYTFLYGEAPAGKLFYFWGRGRNGKSVITNVLKLLHGDENIAGVPLASLGEGFNLSALYDKKICLCPENSKEKLVDTSTLKALTGRDAIKIEKKYEAPFTISGISTKIIVNSNHFLRTDDTSVGFWERILPIPFEVTFLSKEEWHKGGKTAYFRIRNTKLEQKLKKELPGIFNWSIQGLKRLRDNQWAFTNSAKINDFKNKMMMYCKPVSAFVAKFVRQGNMDKQEGKIDRIQTSKVHESFLSWSSDMLLEVGEYDSSRTFRKAFMDSLEERGINVKIVKNSVDYYVGIIVE